MHSCRILFIMLLIAVSMSQVSFSATDQMVVQKMNRMPLPFTQNNGQWDERVLFRATAGGATMWFTREGVTYQFTRRIPSPPSPLPREGEGSVVGQDRFGPDTSGVAGAAPNDPIPLLRGVRGVSDRDSIEQLVLTAKFIGANPNPEVIAEGLMEYECNYFIGNDLSKWHTNVPNYEAITLKDIYPGIDLKCSGDGSDQASYEFIAVPGADIAQIKVEYEGVEETSIDADGRMILETRWGDLIAAIQSPAYSPLPLVGEGPGERAILSGKACFSQLSEETVGLETNGASRQALGTFAVGLVYSTYLGGPGVDRGRGIAVDGSGNAYVTGYTLSSNFPTIPGDYDTTYNGGSDAFVAKFSPNGELIYSTYLGGAGAEGESYVHYTGAIAVDGSGNAYVTGWTGSSDFPTLNPYQATKHGGSDVFVTKLSSYGNSLIYSTYLGGNFGDQGYSIAVDDSDNAYVTGSTSSSNFPTLNPYQGTFQGGYYDAFVTELSSSGSSLIYSTYLGGASNDVGVGIAVDGGGNAYVTGQTESSDFPVLSPYQTGQGYYDAFVTKLSNSGNSLMYSTYLGGNNFDWGEGIAVDGSGNAYVTGRTFSENFPTQNPYQMYQGHYDAFVTKLSSSGSSLIYSTFLGGANQDVGVGIAVDGGGNAYVVGSTSSLDFPTLNPYQTYQDAMHAFVTELSSFGNSLVYSTYLGKEGADSSSAIAVDGSGNAYVTGLTNSSEFPTKNPFQSYQGGGDAFVTKLSVVPDYICGDADGSKQVDISDAVYLVNYIFGGGPEPLPFKMNGDVDCSEQVDISDAVYLVNYIFSGGLAPCAACK